MSLVMWIILQMALLFLAPALEAAVLVVPSQGQTFDSYRESCTKENFLCTHTVIKEKLAALATPKYDQLILDLDLQSSRFTTSLNGRVKEVLETEMISIEQLESLINILERVEEVASTKQNKLLKVELSQILEMTLRAPTAENFSYFIFKKPVKAIPLERLKSFSVRPYMKEIDFKGEVIDQQPLSFKAGNCSQSRLSDLGQIYFNETSYIFADDENCSWTDSVREAFKSEEPSVESKYKMSVREKNVLLWSTVAVAAGLFLSHYDLTVEF